MALIAKPLEASEIFICNTSNIDSMRHGRPQTVMFKEAQVGTEKLHNGAIVALEGTKETQANPELDHVHGIVAGAQTELIGKFIIVDPEISVEQSRRIHNSLAYAGLTPLQPETTYTAYELQKLDRIEYSLAYFDALKGEIDGAVAALGATPTKAQIEAATQKAVADFAGKIGTDTLTMFNIDGEGQLVGVAVDGALRVVSVREQRIPLMMDANHNNLPGSYFMVKLEVVK